jgi:hypothetical protein
MCWGDGQISRCCNDQVIETPSGKKKCVGCGGFCKVRECDCVLYDEGTDASE